MLKRYLFSSAIWAFVMFFWALPALAEMIVDTAWVRTYNGSANWDDCAYDLAIDRFGNVYVTGYTNSSGTDEDYTTIKYYPNGDTAWVRQYNGPENGNDVAKALAVDSMGNVYVTGESMGTMTRYDYATIKYYTNGDTAWVRRYRGPAYHASACDIAVDDSGNTYVTGWSYGSLTSSDYATIKYDQYGNELWVARYDGGYEDEASALTLDDSGYVYVTGQSYLTSYQDYATVKYRPSGDTVWVRTYSGPGNHIDSPTDVAVDDSGNVYVTGESVGNGTHYDFATVKYYPNGNTAWVSRYGSSGADHANALAVDHSGNVYVTGYGYHSGTDYDCYTIKYYPNGDTAWVRKYNGPGNSFDDPTAIMLDDSSDVYITGGSTGIGTSTDCIILKYAPDGDELWVKRYNGPSNLGDGAYAIYMDSENNVCVSGASRDSGTSNDYLTIKYSQTNRLRGDANGDAVIDVGDVVYIIDYLFKSGPAPSPLPAGDATCDGNVDVGDVVYLINYLFKSGPPPSC